MEKFEILDASFLSACTELGYWVKYVLSLPCPMIFEGITIGEAVTGGFAVSILVDMWRKIME